MQLILKKNLQLQIFARAVQSRVEFKKNFHKYESKYEMFKILNKNIAWYKWVEWFKILEKLQPLADEKNYEKNEK